MYATASTKVQEPSFIRSISNTMKTSTYNYTTKYIPVDFWDILNTDEILNIRLLKDVTGCGATYGIMKKPYKQVRILVMPTIKLIQDKQRQADKGEFGFINVISLHGESKSTKDNIEGADIILMTPDQLVKIYEKNTTEYDMIKNGLLVIDEEHTFEGAGTYRVAFGKLDHIVEHNWTGSIITITATPPFSVSPYFQTYDIIQLRNNTRTIHEVEVTKSTAIFDRRLEDIVATGERVVIVTNDISYFRSVKKQWHHLGIHTKTGNTIKEKLMYEGFINNNQGQIIIITTSATEGIDLDIDAHVMILSDYKQDAYIFSLQTMIQALGRPRGNLMNSMICIDVPAKKDPNKSDFIYQPILADEIEDAQDAIDRIQGHKTMHEARKIDKLAKLDDTMLVKDDYAVNVQKICAMVANATNHNIFHSMDFREQMNKYASFTNIKFIEPVQIKISNSMTRKSRPKFHEIIADSSNLTLQQITESFNTVKFSVKGGKRYGSIQKNYLLVNLLMQLRYLTDDVNILQAIGAKSLTAARAAKLLNSVCVKQNYINKEAYIAALSPKQKLIRDLNKTTFPIAATKRLASSAIANIEQSYKFNDIYFNQQQVDVIQSLYYISMTNKDTKQIIENEHNVSIIKKGWSAEDSIKRKASYSVHISDLMGLCINQLTEDRQQFQATRVYSAVTHLSKRIINQVHPQDVLEIDITSANPTFVDARVGSNLKHEVYNNIMDIHNITRDEAKVKYNILLNTSEVKWYQSHSKEWYLIRWGYTSEQAKAIVEQTAEQGNMFYYMTTAEQDIIAEVVNQLNIQPNEHLLTIRRHDAIMICGRRDNMNRVIGLVNEHKFAGFDLHITKSWLS